MIRTTVRRAKRAYPCETGHPYCSIHRGEIYLEHVASPDHDGLGNDCWWTIRECEGCAKERGRRELIVWYEQRAVVSR